MTFNMRISTFDRLTVEGRYYQLIEQTETGYVFQAQDPPRSTLTYGVAELRNLLQKPDVLLERDYYLAERASLRLTSNVDALASLPDETASEVLWRAAYVQALQYFERKGLVKRTEHSVNLILKDIEAFVNKKAAAAQRGWLQRRAGQKKIYRDRPCARTLLEWRRRFERAANSPLGLAPRTHRSGNRGSRFGRTERRLIKQSIDQYLTRNRLSKRMVAQNCKRLFEAENEKRASNGEAPLLVPSQRKIERDLAKLDPYATYAHRYGIEAANRKFILYETGIEASYPMERIEIDEWRVDLIGILVERGALDGLTAKELAELPHGRRWLYLAIDCATRCVVGMRLAATPNSEDAVALLSYATRDKTDLARAAGCKSDWDHFGGLSTVSTDLGPAFVDDVFRNAVFDVLGTPESPPGGQPHLRSRVERIFGTFGTSFMPGRAGHTFSNPKERGDYPSEDLASITDDELMQMLVLYVVDVYHNRPHAGLKGETPNNCWKRLAAEKGTVPDVPERLRRRAFGKPFQRTVTGKGVCVFGIDYTCAALRQFHLHDPQKKVELRVDLNDLGWIVVRVGQTWYPALALQKCFEGVSYDEWTAAARELRLKHRSEAAVFEKTVAETLKQIAAINASAQHRFSRHLRNLTPAGLRRGKEDLFLGLSIKPDKTKGFDLPPDDDLFGAVVPLPNSDKGNGGAEAEITQSDNSDGPSDETDPYEWRFDDD